MINRKYVRVFRAAHTKEGWRIRYGVDVGRETLITTVTVPDADTGHELTLAIRSGLEEAVSNLSVMNQFNRRS